MATLADLVPKKSSWSSVMAPPKAINQGIPVNKTPVADLAGSVRRDTYNALSLPAAPQYPTFNLPQLGAGGNGYDAAYQKSLATARAGVEAQLRNALGEVARQEKVQQEMVGQLPGQYDKLRDQATGQSQQFAREADAAQASIGPAAGTSSAGAIAPLLAAMSMAHATQQAGVPTLGLAVSDAAARQRGAVNQAGMGALADIDAEERGALASRSNRSNDDAFKLASMQNENSLGRYQAELAAQQRQQDIALDDRRAEESFGRQLALTEAQRAPKDPARRFGALEISSERGAALKNAMAYRRNSAYTKLVDKLMGRTAEEVPALVAEFERKHKKADPRAMSMALFDLFGQPQGR